MSYKYDKANNLRYTQDANQTAAGKVYFTTYDFANRPLTSGQGSATFSSLDPDAASPPALESTQGNWLTVRKYDAKPTNVFPWSTFWTQINPLALSNVSGRLAAVATKSSGAWQVELYSYDTDGRVNKRYVYTQASSGSGVWTALNTTHTYTYNLRGDVTQTAITVGSTSFYQWYDFNTKGQLWKAFASMTSTKPATPDVTYTYRPSGKVWTRKFKNAPLDSMHYTIREQLERIGNPAVTTASPISTGGRVLAGAMFASISHRTVLQLISGRAERCYSGWSAEISSAWLVPAQRRHIEQQLCFPATQATGPTSPAEKCGSTKGTGIRRTERKHDNGRDREREAQVVGVHRMRRCS